MDQDMDAKRVHGLVLGEVNELESFVNYHGLTRENLESHIVWPYQVEVDLDDAIDGRANVWVVLKGPSELFIVFDPKLNFWGVAESVGHDEFILVVQCDGLRGALEDM